MKPTEPSVAERSEDVAAVIAIVLVVVVVSLPALRGELLTYVDNPAHMAEIHDLARASTRGWSELAFCGFPLHLLQPPLTFGILAQLTRWGAPLEATCIAVTVMGLAAPALAFYYFARKRLTAGWAFALACSLLLYRGSLVGGSATLGGMFGFHLASAAWILVLDVLTQRRDRTLRDAAWLAGLAAVIGLTHFFITIALIYLALLHVAWSLVRKNPRRLLYDLPALALGAITAAAYWLPNFLARTPPKPIADSFGRVLSRLFTTSAPPLPPGTVRFIDRITSDPALQLDALLQVVVVGIAVLGVREMMRAVDDAPRYGASVTVLFLGLLFIQPRTGIPFLGPQGWRLIYIVKICLLAVAIPLVEVLSKKVANRRAFFGFAAASALGLALLSQQVVRAASVPRDAAELADVDRMWSWLREHRTASWGRVFVQDTFGVGESGLFQSHLPTLTSERTGIEQLGVFYGGGPYQRDEIFSSLEPADANLVGGMVSVMDRANATHLLLANPIIHARFEGDGRFVARAKYGQFLLLERQPSLSRWGQVLDGDGTVDVDRVEPGRIRVAVQGSWQRIMLSESYHSFWRTEPAGAADLSADAAGLMLIDRRPGSGPVIELRYTPPSIAMLLTFVGAGCILCLFLADAVLSRRASMREVRGLAAAQKTRAS